MINYKDYIEYKTKENYDEEEIAKNIVALELLLETDECLNDILYLLETKELSYMIPYKTRDRKTPAIVDAFQKMDIKLESKEKIVNLKDGTHAFISFQIV